MPDRPDLIATLQNSLDQTKNALKRRIDYREELQNNRAPAGELAEVDAEIALLENSVETTDLAISSLLKRFQTDGGDGFGLDFEKR